MPDSKSSADQIKNRSSIYHCPAIPLAISLISGIAAGVWFHGYELSAWILTIVCVCLIFCRMFKNRPSAVLPLILFLSSGYISVQSWMPAAFPQNHISRFTDSDKFKITGVVYDYPEKSGMRTKFVLETETLKNKNNSFPVTGKIRVTLAGRHTDINTQDRVAFFSRIRSIRNFNNPGGFDYEQYMKFKKIYGRAYVPGNKIQVVQKGSSKWPGSRFRSNISGLIDAVENRKAASILKALIIGVKTEISGELRDAFNRSGLGHLLAISGLHIGMVASVAFFIFRWILCRFKTLLWHAWTKKGAAILCFFPVAGYGLLAGMSPSTERAVIMVFLFFTSFLFEREYDPINTAALAALIIVIIDPRSIFSISFQLSFAAIFSILYGLSVIKAKAKNNISGRFWFAKKLFVFFLVSLFAIFGTLPLVMFYFNQISFTGLFTNFIFIPLIGFVIVPLGLLAVVLYLFSPGLAQLAIFADAHIVEFAVNMVCFFADMRFAAFKTVTPSWFEILCYYLLGWSILNLICIKSKKHPRKKTAERALNSWSGLKLNSFKNQPAKIILILVVTAFAIDALYWSYERFWRNDLRVTIIDVGQGSAGLLELPKGPVFLVDGGGFFDNSAFDVGAMIVGPLLWRKKIRTVDTLVLSHANSDHLNGLLYIAEHFNVKNVWTNNDAADTVGYQRFINIIKKNKINMPDFDKMPGKYAINQVALEILYPPKDFLIRKKRELWRDSNSNSLVLRAKFGEKSFLFTGDIFARSEEELIAMSGNKLNSSVLIAPHHGSKTSSSADFIDKVSPDIVVMSLGWKNWFGFPHREAEERYNNRGVEILRTDIHGAVEFSTDGKTLETKTAQNL